MSKKPYNPYDEFIERANNYGFEYKIIKAGIVECNDGVERYRVAFETETNKEGYCLIGLMSHWKYTELTSGRTRCSTFNYMLIEPRMPTMYFDINEDGQPICTTPEMRG